MRAIIIPLVVLLTGCVTSPSPDSSQCLCVSHRDEPVPEKLKLVAESNSSTLRIARIQKLLALLGYDPGIADGIIGRTTRSAMKKAAADLHLTMPDEAGLTSFARALETERTKRVRVAQEQLAVRGYDPGSADGHLGPRTRKALAQFRADHGLPDSPTLPSDWTSQPVKQALVAVVRAEPAIQPPTNDALPSPSPNNDQELLSTGQRIIVLLPGQKEGSVLTISDDGTVEVPDLGPVQAAGQRPSDVEKAIAVGFFDRYVATLAGAVRVNSAPP